MGKKISKSFMPSLTKQWLNSQCDRRLTLLKRLTFSDSADYQAWRHRFLQSRVKLFWGLAFAYFLTIFIFELKNHAFPPKINTISFVSTAAMGISLLICFWLQRIEFCRRYPMIIFLAVSWSYTLAPHIIETIYSCPDTEGDWDYFFILQALLLPVGWWWHLLSHLVPIVYFVGVNSALGLTSCQGEPINNTDFFVVWIWISFICTLAVYLYERARFYEFSARRELRVFLHSISHDLSAPVTGTSMILNNILKNTDNKDDNIVISRQMVESLLAGNNCQLNLINSLIEAHRTEVQGIILNSKPFQLHSLVRIILTDLQPILVKNRVILINQVNPNLTLVTGDRTQLWRVLNNLIDNALKHNPYGIELTLDAKVKGKVIYFLVRDNGLGIAPEQQKKLFQLYRRGDRARYMPGLGLGLYLCQQIIRAHGGEIGVDSKVNEGSTFWFTLPLEKSQKLKISNQ
jgi:signal transduction histidine kinase